MEFKIVMLKLTMLGLLVFSQSAILFPPIVHASTPTWYGMFNESGEQTAAIDELTRIWTEQYPANRAPLSHAINGKQAVGNVRLRAGLHAAVQVLVSEPNQDPIRHQWVLMREDEKRSQGGHFEAKPAELKLQIMKTIVHVDYIEMTFKLSAEKVNIVYSTMPKMVKIK